MSILFISVVVLVACGKDEADTSSPIVNDKENNQETESSKSSLIGDTPDQLDLSIGDTGKFDTTLGTFDLTLDSVKLIGTELDGVTTDLDEFILIDLTIKNTSNHNMKIEDVLLTLEITDNLEMQGEKDRADLFDSVDYFTGNLEPNEEAKGQFIAETYTADTYYFQESIGDIAAGVSNQVRWTFAADEAK